jgi:hypothetical protein
MGIIELLRRMVLLFGVGCFLWLWLESPPVLLEVSRADFASQYQRRYGKRNQSAVGVMELGEQLIRETTDPGSLAAFTTGETAHQLLPFGDSNWTDFYRSLSNNPVYYAIDRPPFAAIRREIESIFSRTQRAVMYLSVRDGTRADYIKIGYVTRPKSSKAPVELLHPKRQRAWPWLVGALLLYSVIPWPRRGSNCAAYNRAVVLSLDALGLSFAATFFALPLFIVNSTAEVLGSESGMTLFLWAFGATGLLMTLWAARITTFSVATSPSGLRLNSFWHRREISFSDMSATGYMVRGEIRTGIFIRCRNGGIVRLDWASLLGFEVILQSIAAAGVAKTKDMAA